MKSDGLTILLLCIIYFDNVLIYRAMHRPHACKIESGEYVNFPDDRACVTAYNSV